MGVLDDGGEPWDASDVFNSHAAAPDCRSVRPRLGPRSRANAAAAAADGLPQWAAAWRRGGGSGGQLPERIFTTRGDRIVATRSW